MNPQQPMTPSIIHVNPTNGITQMAHPQLVQGGPQPGEDPFYVNAKQYNRILKRRDARARWEQKLKNQKKDKV